MNSAENQSTVAVAEDAGSFGVAEDGSSILIHSLAKSLIGYATFYGEDDSDKASLDAYLQWCELCGHNPVFTVDERVAGIHAFRPIAEMARVDHDCNDDDASHSLNGSPLDAIGSLDGGSSEFGRLVSNDGSGEYSESVYSGADGVSLNPSVFEITGRYEVDFENQWIPFEASSLVGLVRQMGLRWVGNIRSDSPQSWALAVKGSKVVDYSRPSPRLKDRIMGKNGVNGSLRITLDVSMEVTVFNRDCDELSVEGDILEVLSRKLESPPVAISNAVVASGVAMTEKMSGMLEIQSPNGE